MSRIQKGLVALAFIALAIFAGYSYLSWKKSITNPNYHTEKENQKTLRNLAEIYQIPEAEQPQIATVSSLAELSNQPFFVNAKVGDRVIVFVQAKFAILYRPSEDKIINSAPISF